MLLRPHEICFRAQISEQDLRQRMADEVMQSIGALDENGKPLKGVQFDVRRCEGRSGGYTITVKGPMLVTAMIASRGD